MQSNVDTYDKIVYIYIPQLCIWLIFCFIGIVREGLKLSNPLWKCMAGEVIYGYFFPFTYFAYILFHWQSLQGTNNEHSNMDTYDTDITHTHTYIYIYLKLCNLLIFCFVLNVSIIHFLWIQECIQIHSRIFSWSRFTHALEYWSELEFLFWILNLESGFASNIQ